MANLKDLKFRIASVRKTQQITRAMKMVAASKMKRATTAISKTRPYAEKMKDLMSNLFSDAQAFGNEYTEVREVNKVLILVVAADKGLCGGFNNNIRKRLNLALKKYSEQNITVSVISVGRKAVEMCKKVEGLNIVGEYPNIFNKITFDHAVSISNDLKKHFSDSSVDKVELIYNKFVNAMTQTPTTEQFLPLEDAKSEEESSSMNTEYIYEPNRVEIIFTLLPRHLNMHVWKILLESNASEQASRMMAMDSATENAGDLIKSMNLKYNNMRQAKITSELAEIVSGAAALEG